MAVNETVKQHMTQSRISVCISVGKSGFSAYFFTPNPDIPFYPDFCAGPQRPHTVWQLLWHRRCRPTDEKCSNVKTITWWCIVFQTSDSLTVNDKDSIEELRVKGVTQEVRLWGLNRTRDRVTTKEHTSFCECCLRQIAALTSTKCICHYQ